MVVGHLDRTSIFSVGPLLTQKNLSSHRFQIISMTDFVTYDSGKTICPKRLSLGAKGNVLASANHTNTIIYTHKLVHLH